MLSLIIVTNLFIVGYSIATTSCSPYIDVHGSVCALFTCNGNAIPEAQWNEAYIDSFVSACPDLCGCPYDNYIFTNSCSCPRCSSFCSSNQACSDPNQQCIFKHGCPDGQCKDTTTTTKSVTTTMTDSTTTTSNAHTITTTLNGHTTTTCSPYIDVHGSVCALFMCNGNVLPEAQWTEVYMDQFVTACPDLCGCPYDNYIFTNSCSCPRCSSFCSSNQACSDPNQQCVFKHGCPDGQCKDITTTTQSATKTTTSNSESTTTAINSHTTTSCSPYIDAHGSVCALFTCNGNVIPEAQWSEVYMDDFVAACPDLCGCPYSNYVPTNSCSCPTCSSFCSNTQVCTDPNEQCVFKHGCPDGQCQDITTTTSTTGATTTDEHNNDGTSTTQDAATTSKQTLFNGNDANQYGVFVVIGFQITMFSFL